MTERPELGLVLEDERSGPVECLGRKFGSDEERREHYLRLLAEKLQDPEFRKTPGFPAGRDEDILRLSDPPYFTACPNPFLGEFVGVHGNPYDPAEEYRREPLAIDVSVGKTDRLYKAHGYHTKVPHLAIVPSILHYTKPGDIVVDGFCGTGMTGVAAQWCGTAPADYRLKLESDWMTQGREMPNWGARRAILGDLGLAATFIAAGYNLPFNASTFANEAQRILDEVENELGWMYETLHSDGRTRARINYTVWSEVFSCPECSGDVVFFDAALDKKTLKMAKEITCPQCSAAATKEQMVLQFETFFDEPRGRTERRPKLVPVLINYSVGKTKYEKKPDGNDLDVLRRLEQMTLPGEMPVIELPDCQMTRVGRMRTTNKLFVHHMFLPRAAQALAALWRAASAESNVRLRNVLLFLFEQAIWGMSVLARYVPTHYSQVNQYLDGVYYVPSQHSEVSPWYILNGKLGRLGKAFRPMPAVQDTAMVTTGDCGSVPVPANSVDYVFTDPPFGENKYYADLNFLVEAWHKVQTDSEPEAIVDRVRQKGTVDYQELMRRCFEEYHRILKPGRWMTVVFSNSKSHIWRAIQQALGTAGFVIADVRTLDKKQGSFKQVTSSAVKQDLVISAYKSTEALTQQFSLGSASADNVWAFVGEHLRNVPVFVGRDGEADVIAERTSQMLHDRMIAFHVQRGVAVPISSREFLAELDSRYPKRDTMYFLPEQVTAYDRGRDEFLGSARCTLSGS